MTYITLYERPDKVRKPQSDEKGYLLGKTISRLRWLGRLPLPVRYVLATFIVLIGLFVRYAIGDVYPGPFLLFIPSVIIVSLLFNRGTGIYACVLSAALAVYFFVSPHMSPDRLHIHDLTSVLIFTAVGLFTAYVIEVLREIIVELEKKTREVVRAESALLHAQKMEAVGRAVSLVAHDFKNLMVPMLGSVELLKRYSHDADQLEVLKTLESSCNNGKKLIDDILLYGRKEPLDFDLHDVNGLIRSHIELLSQSMTSAIRIDMRLEDDIPPVSLQPVLFQRALANLVANAQDAMPEGGAITVATFRASTPEPASRKYVCVSIRDTGSGIPEELKQKIFEPFFTTKPMGEGTGLGLAMVADFIRQAGGEIAVESEPGQGTEFRLYLPALY